MVFTYIERLQKKPPHQRRAVSIAVAAVVTGIIFTGWLMAQTGTSSATNTVERGANDTPTTQEIQSPFTTLGKEFEELWNTAKELGTLLKQTATEPTNTGNTE